MITTIAWTLPRPPKSKYKGGFPLFFEQNLAQLLGYPERTLHPFGGRAEIGERCDLDPLVEPDYVCERARSKTRRSTASSSTRLTAPRKPSSSTGIADAVRVTRPGGWVVLYSDREPRRPARCNHAFRIVVTLRPYHRPRVCMVFQKRKPGMPHYGTEQGEIELQAAA